MALPLRSVEEAQATISNTWPPGLYWTLVVPAKERGNEQNQGAELFS